MWTSTGEWWGMILFTTARKHVIYTKTIMNLTFYRNNMPSYDKINEIEKSTKNKLNNKTLLHEILILRNIFLNIY